MARRGKPAKHGTPPPIAEQKRLRQADRSTVPSPPYLLLSKLLDVGCDLPVVGTACPDGGWRTALPDEWTAFPSGRLAHSFSSYYDGDVERDLSFGDYVRARARIHGAGKQPTTKEPSLAGGVGRYYDYAFRTDSTELGDLTHPVSLCVLLVLVAVFALFKRVFMPRFCALGRRLGRSTHGPEWEGENEDRIVKFGEYVYRLIYHSAVSVYGVWYFRNKSWWDRSQGGTENLWIGHPNHPVEPGMSWYYLVQCAYNVDALISLLTLSFTIELVNPLAYSSALEFLEKEHVVDENQRKQQVLKMMVSSRDQTVLWTPLFQVKWSPARRGDFREMMVHHIVTNTLIFFSSYFRFTRVGSMIFLIHDLSDVPIDMSKLANFVKWKGTTICCFVVMVLTWIVTRLVIFPFVICRSVVMESHVHMVENGPMDPALHDAYYLMFYVLLAALVFLHVTWFLILLRIGWTLVSKGETHDYSEHKNGEKQKTT